MKAWFNSLQPREQQMVLGLTVVVVLLFAWLGIWQPLHEGRQQAQRQLQARERDLVWMEQSAVRLKQAKQQTVRPTSGSLSQQVSTSASQFGVTLSRIQPRQHGLQVWVDNVRYDSLIRWFNALESSGLLIEHLDISAADEPGMVRVRRLELGAQG